MQQIPLMFCVCSNAGYRSNKTVPRILSYPCIFAQTALMPHQFAADASNMGEIPLCICVLTQAGIKKIFPPSAAPASGSNIFLYSRYFIAAETHSEHFISYIYICNVWVTASGFRFSKL